jgi:2,3-dihydroxybiphenyl 1,2-dioxygenase
MAKVTELGYLGIGVSDGTAWKEYATQVVGMELLDEGEADRFYLRMDNWHHRIVVHTSGEDDLLYLGWRVAGPLELQEMEQQLREARVPYRVGNEAEAQERRVLGLLKLADPGGNPIDIFYGPQVETTLPFHPGRRMYGRFLTGDEGIGHVILREDDVAAAFKFYTNVLGMRGSIEYKLPVPGGMIAKPVFLHCNSRDHSIAFGVGPMTKRINHLMIELATIDDLGMTYDIVRSRDIPVAISLGKHSNDQAFTFYCANPSGWLWEIGWGARKATEQAEYYVSDVFGHGVETKGFGLDFELKKK